MADALVSVVLEQLGSMIAQKVEKEVRLFVGVKNEVQTLQRKFEAIQAVLADAEQRQWQEEYIKRWMGQLKDVSYDMDDVLDEWSTAIAKSQMKVNDEHPRKTIKKVCSSMIFSRFREVGLHFDVAREIQTLNERIDGIVSEKKKFHLKLSEGGPNLPERKITASVIDAREIKGRETDKDTIVKMLLSESSDQELAPRTISLVGMGGIGKTTLAQLVYNDHQVETYFEERIWVCVSDPFDEIRIAKAILEGLNESAHNLIELQALLLRIQELIRGKRFLLVLDDVWNEDSTKWEQLKTSLKRGCLPGSRFLVTTRKREVASIMGSSSSDILELELLSPDECWSLFSQFAFFGKNSRERENLEETGRKMADRCKGLPLAAKTLGSLLRFKRSRAEWESVLNNHVWKIKEAESKLFAPLWLSYHDLPSEMRPCFLYCAVFPKDYIFKRDTLIKLWMAQGFLRETQNPEMEVTGGECFEALAARSFFQDFEKDKDDGRIIECKMHDIVHDFAQFMTKNEIFSVEIDGGLTVSKIESFSGDVRHSMVVFRNFREASFPATIHSFKKLRSLIVDGYPLTMNAALPDLIANLSCLRTLKLKGCGIKEVPSIIGKLIHLRHVDLSENRIKELPEEICELYNMQTLDVLCCGLEKLPENIGKLIKLRHLHVFDGDHKPPVKMRGFEGLGCLRELDEFHVSDSGEGSNIGGLKNLNHLQGCLTIKWLGDVKDPDEAKKADLKSKKNLTGLDLWFKSRTERRIIRDDEILEALELPPNIDWLLISDYQGINQVLPSRNNKLRSVQLQNWGKIENLPSLGMLPFLEELSVGSMGRVRKVGREFLGTEAAVAAADDSDISIGEMTASPSTTVIAFPRLKSLSLWSLEEWEEWEGEGRRNEDKTIMPSLRSLHITSCPKLKALPDYIYQSTTLEELQISSTPILEEQFKGGKGWPNTSHTPDITFKAVLKLGLHCQGCTEKIVKIVRKAEGVQQIVIDEQKELVTVKGTMDVKALAETLKERLKRPVDIVPPKKEKEGGKDADNGAEGGGGKKKGGGGKGGVQDGEGAAKMEEINRMEFTVQPGFWPGFGYAGQPIYGNGYVGHPVYASHGPEYGNRYGFGHAPHQGYGPGPVQGYPGHLQFNDENPNACSVM